MFFVTKLNWQQIIMAHESDNLCNNGNQYFPYDDQNCTTLPHVSVHECPLYISVSYPHEQKNVACLTAGSAVAFL
jgi:hypothetical protein